jgi:hypothetical protein
MMILATATVTVAAAVTFEPPQSQAEELSLGFEVTSRQHPERAVSGVRVCRTAA